MKFLVVLLLAGIVFGTGGYFTWKLFVEPQQKLKDEKQMGPPAPPPDPTLPEFAKCVELQQSAKLVEARAAFMDFIERYPQSSKTEEAKNRVGGINSYIFLSTYSAPEKISYTVQKNDVINRVAVKMHTTPELILKANDLHGFMLRIGERLTVSPAEFSVTIDRRNHKVVLMNFGKFFKQYPIMDGAGMKGGQPATPAPGKTAAPTPRQPKIGGRVTEEIAWNKGQRVTPFDKDKGEAYAEADHWIVISPSGHSLYTDHGSDAPPATKPPGGGYGLEPEAMQELAAMLNKNTPVTIE